MNKKSLILRKLAEHGLKIVNFRITKKGFSFTCLNSFYSAKLGHHLSERVKLKTVSALACWLGY